MGIKARLLQDGRKRAGVLLGKKWLTSLQVLLSAPSSYTCRWDAGDHTEGMTDSTQSKCLLCCCVCCWHKQWQKIVVLTKNIWSYRNGQIQTQPPTCSPTIPHPPRLMSERCWVRGRLSPGTNLSTRNTATLKAAAM